MSIGPNSSKKYSYEPISIDRNEFYCLLKNKVHAVSSGYVEVSKILSLFLQKLARENFDCEVAIIGSYAKKIATKAIESKVSCVRYKRRPCGDIDISVSIKTENIAGTIQRVDQILKSCLQKSVSIQKKDQIDVENHSFVTYKPLTPWDPKKDVPVEIIVHAVKDRDTPTHLSNSTSFKIPLMLFPNNQLGSNESGKFLVYSEEGNATDVATDVLRGKFRSSVASHGLKKSWFRAINDFTEGLADCSSATNAAFYAEDIGPRIVHKMERFMENKSLNGRAVFYLANALFGSLSAEKKLDRPECGVLFIEKLRQVVFNLAGNINLPWIQSLNWAMSLASNEELPSLLKRYFPNIAQTVALRKHLDEIVLQCGFGSFYIMVPLPQKYDIDQFCNLSERSQRAIKEYNCTSYFQEIDQRFSATLNAAKTYFLIWMGRCTLDDFYPEELKEALSGFDPRSCTEEEQEALIKTSSILLSRCVELDSSDQDLFKLFYTFIKNLCSHPFMQGKTQIFIESVLKDYHEKKEEIPTYIWGLFGEIISLDTQLNMYWCAKIFSFLLSDLPDLPSAEMVLFLKKLSENSPYQPSLNPDRIQNKEELLEHSLKKSHFYLLLKEPPFSREERKLDLAWHLYLESQNKPEMLDALESLLLTDEGVQTFERLKDLLPELQKVFENIREDRISFLEGSLDFAKVFALLRLSKIAGADFSLIQQKISEIIARFADSPRNKVEIVSLINNYFPEFFEGKEVYLGNLVLEADTDLLSGIRASLLVKITNQLEILMEENPEETRRLFGFLLQNSTDLEKFMVAKKCFSLLQVDLPRREFLDLFKYAFSSIQDILPTFQTSAWTNDLVERWYDFLIHKNMVSSECQKALVFATQDFSVLRSQILLCKILSMHTGKSKKSFSFQEKRLLVEHLDLLFEASMKGSFDQMGSFFAMGKELFTVCNFQEQERISYNFVRSFIEINQDRLDAIPSHVWKSIGDLIELSKTDLKLYKRLQIFLLEKSKKTSEPLTAFVKRLAKWTIDSSLSDVIESFKSSEEVIQYTKTFALHTVGAVDDAIAVLDSYQETYKDPKTADFIEKNYLFLDNRPDLREKAAAYTPCKAAFSYRFSHYLAEKKPIPALHLLKYIAPQLEEKEILEKLSQVLDVSKDSSEKRNRAIQEIDKNFQGFWKPLIERKNELIFLFFENYPEIFARVQQGALFILARNLKHWFPEKREKIRSLAKELLKTAALAERFALVTESVEIYPDFSEEVKELFTLGFLPHMKQQLEELSLSGKSLQVWTSLLSETGFLSDQIVLSISRKIDKPLSIDSQKLMATLLPYQNRESREWIARAAALELDQHLKADTVDSVSEILSALKTNEALCQTIGPEEVKSLEKRYFEWQVERLEQNVKEENIRYIRSYLAIASLSEKAMLVRKIFLLGYSSSLSKLIQLAISPFEPIKSELKKMSWSLLFLKRGLSLLASSTELQAYSDFAVESLEEFDISFIQSLTPLLSKVGQEMLCLKTQLEARALLIDGNLEKLEMFLHFLTSFEQSSLLKDPSIFSLFLEIAERYCKEGKKEQLINRMGKIVREHDPLVSTLPKEAKVAQLKIALSCMGKLPSLKKEEERWFKDQISRMDQKLSLLSQEVVSFPCSKKIVFLESLQAAIGENRSNVFYSLLIQLKAIKEKASSEELKSLKPILSELAYQFMSLENREKEVLSSCSFLLISIFLKNKNEAEYPLAFSLFREIHVARLQRNQESILSSAFKEDFLAYLFFLGHMGKNFSASKEAVKASTEEANNIRENRLEIEAEDFSIKEDVLFKHFYHFLQNMSKEEAADFTLKTVRKIERICMRSSTIPYASEIVMLGLRLLKDLNYPKELEPFVNILLNSLKSCDIDALRFESILELYHSLYVFGNKEYKKTLDEISPEVLQFIYFKLLRLGTIQENYRGCIYFIDCLYRSSFSLADRKDFQIFQDRMSILALSLMSVSWSCLSEIIFSTVLQHRSALTDGTYNEKNGLAYLVFMDRLLMITISLRDRGIPLNEEIAKCIAEIQAGFLALSEFLKQKKGEDFSLLTIAFLQKELPRSESQEKAAVSNRIAELAIENIKHESAQLCHLSPVLEKQFLINTLSVLTHASICEDSELFEEYFKPAAEILMKKGREEVDLQLASELIYLLRKSGTGRGSALAARLEQTILAPFLTMAGSEFATLMAIEKLAPVAEKSFEKILVEKLRVYLLLIEVYFFLQRPIQILRGLPDLFKMVQRVNPEKAFELKIQLVSFALKFFLRENAEYSSQAFSLAILTIKQIIEAESLLFQRRYIQDACKLLEFARNCPWNEESSSQFLETWRLLQEKVKELRAMSEINSPSYEQKVEAKVASVKEV